MDLIHRQHDKRYVRVTIQLQDRRNRARHFSFKSHRTGAHFGNHWSTQSPTFIPMTCKDLKQLGNRLHGWQQLITLPGHNLCSSVMVIRCITAKTVLNTGWHWIFQWNAIYLQIASSYVIKNKINSTPVKYATQRKDCVFSERSSGLNATEPRGRFAKKWFHFSWLGTTTTYTVAWARTLSTQ